jgi:hypothetical protein
LTGESSDIFYDNFKWDLLQLLHNAPNLKTLRIYRGPIEEDGFMVYPEMLPQVQRTHFPKLTALHLSTRVVIFTNKELEIWGFQHGWPELRHLSICRATNLIPFISRVPQLTCLHLTADLGVDMDELSRRLDVPSPTSQPLGVLDTLVYNHFSPKGSASNPSLHIMPWSIIDKVKDTLIRYHSVHQPYEVFRPGYATPNSHDLCLLRVKCPKITDLAVDVNISTNKYESFPVLQAFATFPHLQKLLLYVHRPRFHLYRYPNNPEWYFDSKFECPQAHELIMRYSANIYPDLKVEMKEIVDYAHVGKTWRGSKGNFWMVRKDIAYGNTAAQPEVKTIKARKLRNTFAYLTPQQLERRYHTDHGPETCVIDGIEYGLKQMLGAELQRREKEERLTSRYGSTTVYDELMGMRRM